MWTKSRARTRGILGGIALAIVMTAGAAWADVTTERPSSILILPKIVADGTRDTLIEISNTSNSLVNAHCYYVNGAPQDPTQPPGPTNPPLWQEFDFFLFLTRQQPTQWLVSLGRDVDPFDQPGDPEAGIDPGLVPPAVAGFQGELVCIQVDGSGAPVGGNALTGAATLLGPDGDSSKYNAIGVAGIDVDENPTLNLDDVEYASCPSEVAFTHFAQAVEDPFLGPGSEVTNRLTLVPCTHDFENQVPAQVGLRIFSYDEFEDQLSGNITFTCRFDADLDDALQVSGDPFAPTGGIFGTWKYSRLVANNVCTGGRNPGAVCSSDTQCTGGGTCDGVVGVVGILESAHVTVDGAVTRSAQNLHVLETAPGATIETVSAGDGN
jgi:hypothetical protein